MIERRGLARIKDLLGRFPAVVLVGPRQVGKTTLARACGAEAGGIYLDLESQRDLRKLSDPEDYLSRVMDKLIILDEIQHVPDLFASLRGLIDEGRAQGHRSGRFLLLGSASLELIQQTSETLAGRIAYLELSPFDALETAPDPLDRLWLRGGFPDSYLSESDELSAEYRDFLIRSYLEREIPLFGSRLAPGKVRNLWTMLAHAQGGVANVATLSRNLEIDGRTVAAHLGLLENMLLLRRLPPWHTNVGKRLVKSPKLYIRDSGLVHELLGIGDSETLLGHPVVGGSWEGFVIENLLACAPPRTDAYFYRTGAGAEIDLILKFRTGESWAIEIKRGLSPNLSRGFFSALDDIRPTRSFVVYGGDDRYKLKPEVEAVGLRLLQADLLLRP
ncbi:MAG TPA: ATP-binding protein [Bacteroidia bacterium]|nr:ATP-binding protein [Bacteroidia bacterium]